MVQVGYARVSTDDQNLDSQTDALKEAGCIKTFTDKESGAKGDREGLQNALDSLNKGDTLVVWKLDRLGRSTKQLIDFIELLQEKGVDFKSITEGFDTTTPQGKFFFTMFAAMAEMERALTIERTRAGLKAARARGRVGGRKAKEMTDPKVAAAKKMHKDKDMSIREICESLSISKTTFYRYVNM